MNQQTLLWLWLVPLITAIVAWVRVPSSLSIMRAVKGSGWHIYLLRRSGIYALLLSFSTAFAFGLIMFKTVPPGYNPTLLTLFAIMMGICSFVAFAISCYRLLQSHALANAARNREE